jgi:heterodisulfide reductase subunit C
MLAGRAVVGLWVARHLLPTDDARARAAHFAVWWLHSILVFGFIASIPFTRLFHVIAGPLNLIAANPGLGILPPVTMEELEKTGRIGIGEIRHLSRQQLLSLDACMECGRCEDACPAFATRKPLSPKKVVQDLRSLMTETLGSRHGKAAPRLLHGETIAAETLWSCTACSACVAVCPVRIDPLILILEMRRHLVNEGGLGGTAAASLRRMQSTGNPWGLPASDRARWTDPLNVPGQGPG